STSTSASPGSSPTPTAGRLPARAPASAPRSPAPAERHETIHHGRAPMKAVVLKAPGRFACVERAAPEPGPGEALVRIVAAGICASDVATIKGENPVAAYPLTPGHECVGIVEAAPANTLVRPGDWVTIYPSVGCGACPACREE